MFSFVDIPISEYPLIKDLWIKNKQYHIDIETSFKQQYEMLVFESRMKKLFEDKEKEYKLSIVKDEQEIVGYCISSIKENNGEILSIHVLEKLRNSGIGRKLMNEHIDWMKNKRCEKIGLYVSPNNEKTVKFYKSLGFEENLVYMEMREKETT